MKNFLLKISLLSVFMLSTVLAANQDPVNISTYKPRVELTGKLGYSPKKSAKRNIARLGFVLPIFQQMDRYMTFLSIIGMKDSAKHLEGNFGVGHRTLIGSWIFGGYGFYDARRTENNNLIQQMTFGIEALSDNLEYRGNIYVPFGKSHDVSSWNIYNINYNQQRHTTTFKNSKQNLAEIGLYGFDIEAGGYLPRYAKYQGFLAFYYFNGKNVKAVVGIRIRANFILTHWLSIEVESNIDKKIGHTSYLGMKLSWDFNSSKSKNSQTSINRKMTQLPVRDIDAVTDVRENPPITIYEDTVKGRVAAILPKEVLSDGSIIQSNVPIGIEDINKSTGSISDIAIISRDGKTVHYVGSDDPIKQATQKELDDNKIIDVNISVIDTKTNDKFGQAIAKYKIAKGKMTHPESVISGLVTPKQAVERNVLTETQAAEAGIKNGLTKNQLVNDNGLGDNIVKQVAGSSSTTPKQAVESGILTPEEAAEAGIKNGLTKDQLVNDNGLGNNIIKQVAKSSSITPAQAVESGILTPEEAAEAGIKNGLTKDQLVTTNGLSNVVVKQAAQSNSITPAQAVESGILTPEEAAEAGIKNGLTKNQLVNDNGLGDDIVKQVAQSNSITPRQAVESGILTPEEAVRAGFSHNIAIVDLIDNNSLDTGMVVNVARENGVDDVDIVRGVASTTSVDHVEVVEKTIRNGIGVEELMKSDINVQNVIQGAHRVQGTDSDNDYNIYLAQTALNNNVRGRDLFSSNLNTEMIVRQTLARQVRPGSMSTKADIAKEISNATGDHISHVTGALDGGLGLMYFTTRRGLDFRDVAQGYRNSLGGGNNAVKNKWLVQNAYGNFIREDIVLSIPGISQELVDSIYHVW